MTSRRSRRFTLHEVTDDHELGPEVALGSLASIDVEPTLIAHTPDGPVPTAWRVSIELAVDHPSRETLALYGIDLDRLAAEATE